MNARYRALPPSAIVVHNEILFFSFTELWYLVGMQTTREIEPLKAAGTQQADSTRSDAYGVVGKKATSPKSPFIIILLLYSDQHLNMTWWDSVVTCDVGCPDGYLVQ